MITEINQIKGEVLGPQLQGDGAAKPEKLPHPAVKFLKMIPYPGAKETLKKSLRKSVNVAIQMTQIALVIL